MQSDSLLQHSNNIDLLESDSSDSSSELPGSMNALDSVSSMAAIAALASPQGLPYYPAAGFPRWYLSPPPPARSLLDGIGKPESPMVILFPTNYSACGLPPVLPVRDQSIRCRHICLLQKNSKEKAWGMS